MIPKHWAGFIHLFTPRPASNGRFMDHLRHWSRNRPEINGRDRSHRGRDSDKLTYHKCSLNIPKSSLWFRGGALLSISVTEKCGGCRHGNMEVTCALISSFWYEFVINCFLSKIYSKSIHPPPGVSTVTPAPFRILLNRMLDFLSLINYESIRNRLTNLNSILFFSLSVSASTSMLLIYLDHILYTGGTSFLRWSKTMVNQLLSHIKDRERKAVINKTTLR